MKIFNCEQGSPEWFAVKCGKVSASNFPDVLNKKTGRKTYMFRLLGERLSGETYEAYSNKTMNRGIEVEAAAREYYEALYGPVERVGFIELNENVGCSPDALVGNNGLIQIKCPYPSTHAQYIIENKLPAVYVPQVQGEIWVTDREWNDFVSYDPRVKSKPLWKIRVYRNDDYIKILEHEVSIFVEELKDLESKIIDKNIDF